MNNKLCYCGVGMQEKLQDVTTKYNNKYITVRRVPLHICEEGHVNFSRYARTITKRSLKKAYDLGITEISFEEGKSHG